MVVTAARWAFLALSWLFLAGIVAQVFLAGLGLFAGASNFATHVEVGWILHLAPILVLVAAALARAGRRTLWLAAALVLTVFILPLLPGLREDLPVAAALHPVFALLAFWLSFAVARAAWQLARPAPPSGLEPAIGG